MFIKVIIISVFFRSLNKTSSSFLIEVRQYDSSIYIHTVAYYNRSLSVNIHSFAFFSLYLEHRQGIEYECHKYHEIAKELYTRMHASIYIEQEMHVYTYVDIFFLLSVLSLFFSSILCIKAKKKMRTSSFFFFFSFCCIKDKEEFYFQTLHDVVIVVVVIIIIVDVLVVATTMCMYIYFSFQLLLLPLP